MDDIRSNTTFRPNPVTGTLLNDAGFKAPHRCVLERESDEKEVAMRIESTTFGATWSRHSLRIEPISLSAYPFPKESAATSVDRECPLIEAFG
jgi:hypothetical protein